MTTGFRDSSGVDADAKFAAYLSGTTPAVTGFRNAAGTDVRDLLQPLPGTSGGLHGHRNASGQDFNALFSTTSEQLLTGYTGSMTTRNNASATTTMTFRNTGVWQAKQSGGSGNWLQGGDPSTYEIMFEDLGGVGAATLTPSHAFGTWAALSVNRSVQLTRGPVGYADRSIRVSIRKIGTGTPSSVKVISLVAENYN